MYRNTYYPDYMYHYGVKGMKWGHRKRYYDSNGNLNARGVKKYARAGYAQDSYNSNKSKLGKAYDKVTGAHKYAGDMMYDMSSKKSNKARAEKYVAEQEAAKAARNTPEAKAARRKTALKVGAAAAGTALAAYGAYKVNNLIREKNRDIRIGKELAEANFLINANSANFDTRGRGLSNDQIKAFNDQFNKYAKTTLDRAVASGNYQADHDSFTTAVKNVYNNRKRR